MDASLLQARAVTPVPMRPGWPQAACFIKPIRRSTLCLALYFSRSNIGGRPPADPRWSRWFAWSRFSGIRGLATRYEKIEIFNG
ncbi:hypothetical protein ACFVTC_42145 [Streptomyces sp. NPDC057950]|uniref:hypothetical protein n=1 Tax=Streptomyces sp. NPDC057950 TaxID=3346288 RepID=UPI0036E47380